MRRDYYCTVINWPNFNNFMFQGNREAQGQGERERRETTSWWNSQNTQQLSIKFNILIWVVYGAPNNYSNIKVTDCRSPKQNNIYDNKQ